MSIGCVYILMSNKILRAFIQINAFAASSKAEVRFHVLSAEWIPVDLRPKIMDKVGSNATLTPFRRLIVFGLSIGNELAEPVN